MIASVGIATSARAPGGDDLAVADDQHRVGDRRPSPGQSRGGAIGVRSRRAGADETSERERNSHHNVCPIRRVACDAG